MDAAPACERRESEAPVTEHVEPDFEPDYDTAAQAAFVLEMTMLVIRFRDEVIALAEKYARAREEEMRSYPSPDDPIRGLG